MNQSFKVMKVRDDSGETLLAKAFKQKSDEAAFILLKFLTRHYIDYQAGNLQVLLYMYMDDAGMQLY